jgi:hypothetical protein
MKTYVVSLFLSTDDRIRRSAGIVRLRTKTTEFSLDGRIHIKVYKAEALDKKETTMSSSKRFHLYIVAGRHCKFVISSLLRQ